MSKLAASIAAEVERLSRQVGELAAETQRFISVTYSVGLLTHEELHEVASELSTEVFDLGVKLQAGENHQAAQIVVESPGRFTLIVNLTSADEDTLLRWDETD